ncbi:D-alanine--D-alanine ligase [Ferrimonas balearica]|uniref:D-alanine--D-alanine ligase n=1 Tax=Ferrimonas balearica TaxID=44012 RepID=UPI001C998ACE|nr:D-alanine--D-alanine ligase [Ferrimonas balearica]MBY5923197.1 D-alanine--D-alanine ligase [Ferrimonas balearica]MBY5997427.1 D-alanine--D-alanine ligase [Ferrimonas balearica]
MTEAVKQDKVAVLFGGTSAEREVSLRSGAAVLTGLQRGGIDAHAFDPAEQPLDALKNYDRAFIVLHGRGGEDGTVQGALELMKIPYTGSRVLGCALAMDKVRTKWLWAGIGLPTADFEVVDKESFSPGKAEDIMARLGSPVMVKPACEGSSIGMAKAEDAASLQGAIETALRYDDTVLVEAWVHGPEYTVSILGEEALPAIRMETPNVFYDYEAKYQSQTTQYYCPAGLSDEDETELRVLALKAFKAVGASGWGRVDVMRDADGSWRLLEVNTVPGMTETSLVPKAAKAIGIDFDTLVARILAASY